MRIYLDEDLSPKVAEYLRNKGVDAVSVHEVGMTGASDEEQMSRAASENRVMVTRNRNDFIALTVRFFQNATPHCGLVIVPYSIRPSDFRLLAECLFRHARRYPLGMEPYAIDFVSKHSG